MQTENQAKINLMKAVTTEQKWNKRCESIPESKHEDAVPQ